MKFLAKFLVICLALISSAVGTYIMGRIILPEVGLNAVEFGPVLGATIVLFFTSITVHAATAIYKEL